MIGSDAGIAEVTIITHRVVQKKNQYKYSSKHISGYSEIDKIDK